MDRKSLDHYHKNKSDTEKEEKAEWSGLITHMPGVGCRTRIEGWSWGEEEVNNYCSRKGLGRKGAADEAPRGVDLRGIGKGGMNMPVL